MSEQNDMVEKIERQHEVRYKYLADFTNHQFSPNLRKHYNDSFSKRSNSQDRRSSYQNSNQKRTFEPFQERYQIKSKHFSPSCSTFKPRRETTQQEFSPYDERVDREEEKLNKELLEENSVLRSQLLQAGQTIDCLKLQIAKRQNQNIQIKEMSQADLRYFEKVVAEMTNEIQTVLTKNKILENELIVVKGKLHEEMRRQDQFQRYEEQRRKMEEFKRREDKRLEQFRRDDNRRYEQPRRNTPQPNSRRSVGKLMSRPAPSNQLQQDSLGASKIKIQEDSESANQSNLDIGKNNQNKNYLQKQNRKGEELIESIKSMQLKITGKPSSSLKQLWKWLKGVGHTHSCLKRWKAKATQASTYYTSEKLKELIREACGYIQ